MRGALDQGFRTARCLPHLPRQVRLCRFIRCFQNSEPRLSARHQVLRRLDNHYLGRRGDEVSWVRPSDSRQDPKGEVVCCAYSAPGYSPDNEVVNLAVSEAARKALNRASDACRRVGWISFWIQLSLSIVSSGILLFSVAFTSQNGPGVSLYLTLFGIVCAFLSTFWSFGYTRLARKLRGYSQTGKKEVLQRVRKKDVLATLERGSWINLAGMAATMLGLQATVGLLVAKTLTNATANPFLSGGAGSYNPVLALDVFLVQASTNTLLAHLTSLLCTLYLIRVVSTNAPVPQIGGRPVPS